MVEFGEGGGERGGGLVDMKIKTIHGVFKEVPSFMGAGRWYNYGA